ncbi:MAG: flagellin [Lysobacter sp.]
MSVINTNVMSLNAQRNLNTNSTDLGTTIQRLSSGLRINSAKDDAAGLAISQRFTTQIRGMDQAARNANDGISLAQTAEGALGEIGNNLQRIRELAVQSRNATNSTTDRQALNAEVTQLKDEIQRVAEQTNFNGTKLLNGSFGDAVFQVGADQGQTITVSNMANANTATLGSWTSPSTTGATATGAALADKSAGATFAAITAGDLVINGTNVLLAESAADATAASQATALNSAINTAGITGVTAAVNGTGDGIVLTSSADMTIVTTTGGTASSGIANGNVAATTVAGAAQAGFAPETVLTAEAADRMILAMDGALTAVNSSRADLGAMQNRFSSVINNLQTNSENLSASRSRIMDADYAKETANLSRTQILAQAGTAMLAQANQVPQNVLSLLR